MEAKQTKTEFEKRVLMMEWNEKLQQLRKQQGLTQEELARRLFVSRTAVSKWESGRGYPNIDSLKALAAFFQVTVDQLLSGEELLTAAEEDSRQKEARFRDLAFGFLDCGYALFLILPLFGQKAGSTVQSVSLLALTAVQPYVKALFWGIVAGLVGLGILTLALQNCGHPVWVRNKARLSLLLGGIGLLLFILSQQPYAAVFALVCLTAKVFLSKGR